jgi:hypothetical protein
MRPRLLSEKCQTCIFRPGNLMRLRPGRVRQMVRQTLDAGATITCHETLPYGQYPDYDKAVCRGFYDAHGQRSNLVRIVERLGGFDEVPPPTPETSQ